MALGSFAVVRPRVIGEASGESLLLEHQIFSLVDRGVRGSIRLVGPAGWGKSTAISYMKALAGDRPDLLIESGPTLAQVRCQDSLLLYEHPMLEPTHSTLRMAPWGLDEVQELAQELAPVEASALLGRIHFEENTALMGGCAGLWCAVVRRLRESSNMDGASEGLLDHVKTLFPADAERAERIETEILSSVNDDEAWKRCESSASTESPALDVPNIDSWLSRSPELVSLLKNRPLRVLVAAGTLARRLEDQGLSGLVDVPIDPELIARVAKFVRKDDKLMDRLRGGFELAASVVQPIAASLLLKADPDWAPAPQCKPELTGAKLGGIRWRGACLGGLENVDLSGADLGGASISDHRQANNPNSWVRVRLSEAALSNAEMPGVEFHHCNLDQADLQGVRATFSSFHSCSLRGTSMIEADLRSVLFRQSDLSDAILDGANLSGACLDYSDLRATDLLGSVLDGASLKCVNMEGADYPPLNLQNANLIGADLSDSVLCGSNLRNANLGRTKLSGVDLSSANLRGTNFANASFHLGSTRCGMLVDAPASWGTRTGFYAETPPDEAEWAPEQSSAANLRYTDLRDAQVEGTDFYRVDLRGAFYSAAQKEWFKQCKAILH